MKRISAILLLLIMVVSAGQPLFVMHFCNGELHSFSLLQNYDNANTCCDDDAAPIHYDSHSCTLDINIDNCCDIQYLKVATDDYQNKTENTSSRILNLLPDYFNVLISGLHKLTDINTNTPGNKTDFPSAGLFMKDVSIHTYICIYRI